MTLSSAVSFPPTALSAELRGEHGFAQTSPIDFDFALARYNPDGTLDLTFGGTGTVRQRLRERVRARPRFLLTP